jgi:hypothetical protein
MEVAVTTKAADEITKAAERGLELSDAEVALEHAREKHHKDRKDRAARDEFRDAQAVVAAARVVHRRRREADGPPPEAENVQRDVNGRIMGYTIGGDAVAVPGGLNG